MDLLTKWRDSQAAKRVAAAARQAAQAEAERDLQRTPEARLETADWKQALAAIGTDRSSVQFIASGDGGAIRRGNNALDGDVKVGVVIVSSGSVAYLYRASDHSVRVDRRSLSSIRDLRWKETRPTFWVVFDADRYFPNPQIGSFMDHWQLESCPHFGDRAGVPRCWMEWLSLRHASSAHACVSIVVARESRRRAR